MNAPRPRPLYLLLDHENKKVSWCDGREGVPSALDVLYRRVHRVYVYDMDREEADKLLQRIDVANLCHRVINGHSIVGDMGVLTEDATNALEELKRTLNPNNVMVN